MVVVYYTRSAKSAAQVSDSADTLKGSAVRKDGASGKQVRILHNARCCMGVVLFHDVIVVDKSMRRRSSVFDA